MEEQKRDFKGIWIPKEIWLNTELTTTEKILYSEIDSLNRGKGCFASNEYFAEFLKVKERAIQSALAHLKELGLIVQIGFDGRKRALVAINPKNEESEVQKNAPQPNNPTQEMQPDAPQGCKKMHLSDAKKCTHIDIDYNIGDNSIDNLSHPVSPSLPLTGDSPEPPSRNSTISDALERFQDAWNSKLCDYCPTIAKITVFNDSRRSKVKARLTETAKLMKAHGVEKDLLLYFLKDIIYDRYTNSQFLRGEVPGRNGTAPFKLTIDNITRPEFFAKLVEYRYDDRPEYRF